MRVLRRPIGRWSPRTNQTLYFYEDSLEVYDNKLRKRTCYAPPGVVSAMVIWLTRRFSLREASWP
jgi:hypothetical protein